MTRRFKGGRRVKSQPQLSAVFGKSVKTIRQWIDAGAPKRKGGFYNLTDWQAWVEKYKVKDADPLHTLAGIQLEIKREELFERQRVRNEYERKMVDVELIRKDVFALGKQITAVVTRIPPNIGSILGVEAQRRAQVIVEEALNILRENPLGE